MIESGQKIYNRYESIEYLRHRQSYICVTTIHKTTICVREVDIETQVVTREMHVPSIEGGQRDGRREGRLYVNAHGRREYVVYVCGGCCVYVLDWSSLSVVNTYGLESVVEARDGVFSVEYVYDSNEVVLWTKNKKMMVVQLTYEYRATIDKRMVSRVPVKTGGPYLLKSVGQGVVLMFGQGPGVWVFDTKKRSVGKGKFDTGKERVTHVGVSACGKFVVCGDERGDVGAWELREGQCMYTGNVSSRPILACEFACNTYANEVSSIVCLDVEGTLSVLGVERVEGAFRVEVEGKSSVEAEEPLWTRLCCSHSSNEVMVSFDEESVVFRLRREEGEGVFLAPFCIKEWYGERQVEASEYVYYATRACVYIYDVSTCTSSVILDTKGQRTINSLYVSEAIGGGERRGVLVCVGCVYRGEEKGQGWEVMLVEGGKAKDRLVLREARNVRVNRGVLYVMGAASCVVHRYKLETASGVMEVEAMESLNVKTGSLVQVEEGWVYVYSNMHHCLYRYKEEEGGKGEGEVYYEMEREEKCLYVGRTEGRLLVLTTRRCVSVEDGTSAETPAGSGLRACGVYNGTLVMEGNEHVYLWRYDREEMRVHSYVERSERLVYMYADRVVVCRLGVDEDEKTVILEMRQRHAYNTEMMIDGGRCGKEAASLCSVLYESTFSRQYLERPGERSMFMACLVHRYFGVESMFEALRGVSIHSMAHDMREYVLSVVREYMSHSGLRETGSEEDNRGCLMWCMSEYNHRVLLHKIDVLVGMGGVGR